MLPSFVQGALNSANAIAKAANELELAAQLAHLFTNNVALQEAKERVQAASTCQPEVLTTLSYFVRHFAGGPSVPMLAFLQNFSFLGKQSLQHCHVAFHYHVCKIW